MVKMVAKGKIRRKTGGKVEQIDPGQEFECSAEEANGYLNRRSARLGDPTDVTRKNPPAKKSEDLSAVEDFLASPDEMSGSEIDPLS